MTNAASIALADRLAKVARRFECLFRMSDGVWIDGNLCSADEWEMVVSALRAIQPGELERKNDSERDSIQIGSSTPNESVPLSEAMVRLSASEVACYRWPEDTVEHRALRAAYINGAASMMEWIA